MTPRAQSITRKPTTTAAEIPEGMDSASVIVRYPGGPGRIKKVVTSLGQLPGFRTRGDKKAVRGALTRGNVLQSGHAHLEISEVQENKQLTVELELLPTLHGRTPGKPLTIDDVLPRLGTLLPADDPQQRRAIVSGNFTFDMKRWEPTFPLPFTPPGILERLPGLPKIAGLDFSFDEPSDQQPLHRAFITTYDLIDKMVVRILILLNIEWDKELPGRVLEVISSQLPAFVRRKETKQSAKG